MEAGNEINTAHPTLGSLCCRMCLCLTVLSSGHISSRGRGWILLAVLCRGGALLSPDWGGERQPRLRARRRTRGVRDEGTDSPNVTWQGCAAQFFYSSLSCAKSAANWALLFCVCVCSISGIHFVEHTCSMLCSPSSLSAGKIPVTSRDSNADLFCLYLCFSPHTPA